MTPRFVAYFLFLSLTLALAACVPLPPAPVALPAANVGSSAPAATPPDDLASALRTSAPTTGTQSIDLTLHVDISKALSGEIDYFALGDSIAAGYGLSDSGEPCRQSMRSYPYRVRAQLAQRFGRVRFFHFACSGATATAGRWTDLVYKGGSIGKQGELYGEYYTAELAHSYKWLHNQVSDVLANLNESPTLVTITIGANDFEWADPINAVSRLRSDVPSYNDFVWATSRRVGAAVAVEIDRLLAHPNVKVVLMQQFNPANPAWGDAYDRFDQAVTQLNLTYASFQGEDRFDPARFVLATGLYWDFKGHESPCDLGLNVIRFPYIQAGQRSRDLTYIIGHCFHPNDDGARQIAQRVYEAAASLGIR